MAARRDLDDDNAHPGWAVPGGSDGRARLLASYRRLTGSLGRSAGLSRFYLDSVEEVSGVLGTDRALLCRYDPGDPDYLRVVAGAGPLARLEGAVLPTKGSFEGLVLTRDEVTRVASLDGPSEYFRTAEHRRYVGPAMAVRLGGRGDALGVLLVARAPGAEPFPPEYSATLAEVASLVSSGIAIAEHFDSARGGRRAVDAWRDERYSRQWLESYREIFASRGEVAFRLAPTGSIEWGTIASLVLGTAMPPPDTMTALLARVEPEERIVTQSALRRVSADYGSSALSVRCTLEVAPDRRKSIQLSIWKDGVSSSLLGVIAEVAPAAEGTFAPAASTVEPTSIPVDVPATGLGMVEEDASWGKTTAADSAPAERVEAPAEPADSIEPHMAPTGGGAPYTDPARDVEPISEVWSAESALAAELEATAEVEPAAIDEPEAAGSGESPHRNGSDPRIANLDEPADEAITTISPEMAASEPALSITITELMARVDREKPETESYVLTDFHSHLVPGVDDGAVDEAQARLALERVHAAGVRHLIVTPHLRMSVLRTGEPIVLAHAFKRLVEIGKESFPELKISRGAEVMLDDPELVLTSPSVRLAGTRFVLVEFSGFWIPPRSAQILSRVMERGFVPVVAHPERYENGSAREAMAWREAGARLQVNCGSLLGQYRPAARDRAWELLSAGAVDYMASDYHARGAYPVEACIRLMEENGGGKQAELLLTINPSRLARDEDPLPAGAIRQPTSILRKLARGMLFR